ncbi:MAG: ATP-dependent helicase HrpB [Leptospira sp.]|nr:ATP-dependent helicase HrpB [Leptospira sp.]
MPSNNEMLLPILNHITEIQKSILEHTVTILESPPGTGKTTALPLELLPLIRPGKKIAILEPRRIAAKNAAVRMSEAIHEKPGGKIGYRVRFESKISKDTQIEFLTDGIFTKLILDDPELSDYDLILFDEFHERRLETDLCYALTKRTTEIFRSDLKILIMSATLEGKLYEKLGIKNPPIQIEVPSHPLEIFYLGSSEKRLEDRLLDLIPKAIKQLDGDILVFLSGKREIQSLTQKLQSISELTNQTEIFPLHGNLSLEEQTKVFQFSQVKKRKVVLSTNLAESSVTVPGVRIVIDTGFQKKSIFEPELGSSKLIQTRISLSSAKQRSGRAAREGKGIAYRLWDKADELGFLDFNVPEILESDLDSLLLQTKLWGENLDTLPFPDKPQTYTIHESIQRLKILGCLDTQETITDLGKETLKYPTSVRLASILARLPDSKMDFLPNLLKLDFLVESNDSLEFALDTNIPNSYEWKESLKQVERLKKESKFVARDNFENYGLVELLSFGYSDQFAIKRPNKSAEYKLANGKSILLQSNQIQTPESILVLKGISFGELLKVVSYIPLSIQNFTSIHKDRLQEVTVTEIQTNQKGEEYLVQKTQSKFMELVFSEKPNQIPDPNSFKSALIDYLRKKTIDDLFSKDPQLYSLYKRIHFLNHHGILNLPISSENLMETLDDWFFPFFTFDKPKLDLSNLPVYKGLLSLLSYEDKRLLDIEAPEYYTAPTGSKNPIEYSASEAQISIKLQELFGTKELPKIAGGKVAILVQLLSPAKRPVQITKDLNSFWNEGYHEVKKELKGKYPKHPWPDKPWEAIPTKHTNRYNSRS